MSTYESQVSDGVRRAAYEVESVRFAPSDPPDGAWYTAIARCSVVDERGRSETALGYASDVTTNQQVVDRAVSEGVERATARLIHRDDPAAAYKTTTGSAVHRTPGQALTHARRELIGSLLFIRRFHDRDMGTKLPEARLPFAPRSAEVTAWMDPALQYIFCAVLQVDATPKLAMTVRDCSDVPWQRARELSVLEILQPRPWVRHHLAGGSQDDPPHLEDMEIRTVADRAVYWSRIESRSAIATYRELRLKAHIAWNAPATAQEVFDCRVVADLRLTGELGPLCFARVEDSTTRGRYVSSELESAMFGNAREAIFRPHPMI
ncbi:hypothetical protein LAUMK191_05186 [Mycobacterium attenuatum]|uniref:Uncharacterized protein n=1 Tax=Mycobacterium attenuatum TaxID=2341086 RepID=A0A498QFW6_9MYCO|nr:hypothetical protein LAUMK136_05211 [Mycobacterium attenuatum]VBA59803.1 hypothetical protein LAUMK191_05186 [Mycobacterium attenuatum]VBA61967.1 hypothetical protein LAUMK41_05352 [Mycobacterium attenuatum]